MSFKYGLLALSLASSVVGYSATTVVSSSIYMSGSPDQLDSAISQSSSCAIVMVVGKEEDRNLLSSQDLTTLSKSCNVFFTSLLQAFQGDVSPLNENDLPVIVVVTDKGDFEGVTTQKRVILCNADTKSLKDAGLLIDLLCGIVDGSLSEGEIEEAISSARGVKQSDVSLNLEKVLREIDSVSEATSSITEIPEDGPKEEVSSSKSLSFFRGKLKAGLQ